MKLSIPSARSWRRAWLRDRRGATAMLVGVLAPVMFASAGVAIDIGRALEAQRALQSSTDAAAMAGAQFVITNPGQAITSATAYGAGSGGLNASPSFSASMVPGYPTLKCFNSTGIICGGTASANGIVVKQQANLPTFFLNAVGIKSIPITTTATASASGGMAKPMNVEIIVDTGSRMSSPDPNCGMTRIKCALTGVSKILFTLQPSADYVGLMTFPPVSGASVSAEYCGASGPAQAVMVPYWSSATDSAMSPAPEPGTDTEYEIVPLSSGNDYRSSDTATTLNSNSDLVKATGAAGGSTCAGLQLLTTAFHSSYYADAIAAAQAKLAAIAATRPNSQNVLVFVSSGDASAALTTASGSPNMAPGPSVPANTTGVYANQCREGVAQAQQATAAGTWVFAVAYGAPTTDSCFADVGAYNGHACLAMQNIASDSAHFFSDNATTCLSADNPTTGLIDAFTSVGQALLPARLIADNTT